MAINKSLKSLGLMHVFGFLTWKLQVVMLRLKRLEESPLRQWCQGAEIEGFSKHEYP